MRRTLVGSPEVTRPEQRARAAVYGFALALLTAAPLMPSAAVRAAEPPPATGATAPALLTRDELLALLRATPGVTATYREIQHIALLAAPLVSEGTMHFAPPGRLAKHQSRPAPSRMVVTGGRLRFADAFGGDELELARSPVVALFVHSVLQVLSGDVEAIERDWYVGFAAGGDGDPRAWVLILRPRGAAGAKIVDALSIRGREAVVSRIEVTEHGGDRTVTTLADVDVDHRWEPAELARVFSLATP